MVFSLLVAFIVTPWAAVRLLEPAAPHHAEEREDRLTRALPAGHGRAHRTPRAARWRSSAWSRCCCSAPSSLVPLRLVTVKMLPFDNKSEFQVIVDMPEGTPLEETARVARRWPTRRCSDARGGERPELRRARRRRTTSTAWCATTSCGAGRTWPTSR